VFFGEPGAEEMAGDIAISLETAGRQAVRYGHSLRDEVRVLMLHGVLHLAGFDHETDAGEMAAREGELRREMGLAGGVIGRVVVARRAKGGSGGRKVRGVGAVRGLAGSFALERRAQDDSLKHTNANANANANANTKAKAKAKVGADSSAALRNDKQGALRNDRRGERDSRDARALRGESGRPIGSIPHPAAIKPRRGWGTQAKKRVRA
jgi:hypothetical protein